MSNSVKPIPDGYHTVTPYLIIKDAARALEFYKKALGATELLRMPDPGGKLAHEGSSTERSAAKNSRRKS